MSLLDPTATTTTTTNNNNNNNNNTATNKAFAVRNDPRYEKACTILAKRRPLASNEKRALLCKIKDVIVNIDNGDDNVDLDVDLEVDPDNDSNDSENNHDNDINEQQQHLLAITTATAAEATTSSNSSTTFSSSSSTIVAVEKKLRELLSDLNRTGSTKKQRQKRWTAPYAASMLATFYVCMEVWRDAIIDTHTHSDAEIHSHSAIHKNTAGNGNGNGNSCNTYINTNTNSTNTINNLDAPAVAASQSGLPTPSLSSSFRNGRTALESIADLIREAIGTTASPSTTRKRKLNRINQEHEHAHQAEQVTGSKFPSALFSSPSDGDDDGGNDITNNTAVSFSVAEELVHLKDLAREYYHYNDEKDSDDDDDDDDENDDHNLSKREEKLLDLLHDLKQDADALLQALAVDSNDYGNENDSIDDGKNKDETSTKESSLLVTTRTTVAASNNKESATAAEAAEEAAQVTIHNNNGDGGEAGIWPRRKPTIVKRKTVPLVVRGDHARSREQKAMAMRKLEEALFAEDDDDSDDE